MHPHQPRSYRFPEYLPYIAKICFLKPRINSAKVCDVQRAALLLHYFFQILYLASIMSLACEFICNFLALSSTVLQSILFFALPLSSTSSVSLTFLSSVLPFFLFISFLLYPLPLCYRHSRLLIMLMCMWPTACNGSGRSCHQVKSRLGGGGGV